jgi:hypothetical protein
MISFKFRIEIVPIRRCEVSTAHRVTQARSSREPKSVTRLENALERKLVEDGSNGQKFGM